MKTHYSTEKLQYIRYFVENKIPGSWHLDALCVRKGFRNQGIGSRLMMAVKERASICGFKTIGVFVFGSNLAAHRFYQRHGFTQKLNVDTNGHEFLGSRQGLCLMEYQV